MRYQLAWNHDVCRGVVGVFVRTVLGFRFHCGDCGLDRLVAQGRTLIVATHDEDFARALSPRILRLENGVIVNSGAGL